MDEKELYELLGRKQTALENESQQYRNLLGLLLRIQNGEVDISKVIISMEAGSWVLMPPEVET